MSAALPPPGSSSYSSNTMNVGDGTWDSQRQTFLLPNLMGLNFKTMQYNGMGNRFKDLPYYHGIVAAHGSLAAITFLGIIPAAIFFARFYHRDSRLALRLHIMLQILTVLFATVILVLGWFAVGPKRSLTNPHHGIGLALYVLVLFQFLFGAWIHHREKNKVRYRLPAKLMLHQWLGRAIALLGIAQVPLGLTLYGASKVFFILYSLWMFFLFIAYFVLSFQHQTVLSVDEHGSYVSGSHRTEITEESRHHGRLGLLGAAGAGAALAALGRRRSKRESSRERTDHSSRRSHSGSYDEKSTESHRDHGMRNRLATGAAGVGLFALARNLFSRRKDESESSDVSASYHRPLGGNHPISQSDLSRVEQGLPPSTPTGRRYNDDGTTIPPAIASTGRRRRSGGSVYSDDSRDSRSQFYSPGKDKRRNHGTRNTLAALGAMGYLRHKMNQRKEDKENRRVAEMRERERHNERINRANSKRYTGDGTPSRSHRRQSSVHESDYSESDLTPIGGSHPELSRNTLPRPSAGATLGTNQPGTGMPPPPPMHSTIYESSNDPYVHPRHRHEGAATAGALATGAALEAASARRDTSRRRSSNGTPQSQTPVSVQVNMQKDGGRVTLRRLTPEEAAAKRDARRRERGSRTRTGSVSSAGASGDDRWRRVEEREAREAAQAAQQHNLPPPAAGPSALPGPPPGPPPPLAMSDLPPPPPIPATQSYGPGSPGGGYETTTSVADSRANSNRRRRRAERARIDQTVGRGSRVDFT
ncbi:hypothetical protein EJ06DRAFT_543658 [Trichodelitschia bisporula]|uniref:Cytochrome b561 domain-containing protein n=1 Tax=Trichodelitschia bisporula TaxID=703511 RepID=A0A6G1HUG3_9PEZI|nr:hypothetical protein EJ06DRAFT_543658 [Trichodelitschia bisporula]